MILKPYVDQGLVELVQNTPVVTNFTRLGYVSVHREEIKMRAPLLLNDCMYRHMYQFKYMVLSDLDEVIIPQNSSGLAEMIKTALAWNHNTRIASVEFSNYYFLMNRTLDPDYRDRSKPRFTAFLQHRKRIGPSPRGSHIKSIISPVGCASVTNHRCATTIDHYKSESPVHYHISADNTTDIGHNQHYRYSVCYVTRRGRRCRDGADADVVYRDNTILRYEHLLVRNVEDRLKELKRLNVL